MSDSETMYSNRNARRGTGDRFVLLPSAFSKEMRFHELIFPNIRLYSLVNVVNFICVVMYIVSLILGTLPDYPLHASNESLSRLGANIPSKIRDGHFYRLVTAIFLHAGPYHISVNLILFSRSGYTIEKRYGLLSFILVILVSGCIGNLLSATFYYNSYPRVGAASIFFAVIGMQLAELFIFWHSIDGADSILFQYTLFFFFIVFFAVNEFGLPVDHLGHCGGLLAGFAFGIIFNRQYSSAAWIKIAYALSYAFLYAFPAVTFLGLLLGPM